MNIIDKLPQLYKTPLEFSPCMGYSQVLQPRQNIPSVKLPLTDDQTLDPYLRNFSGHCFENQSFTKFTFLFEEIRSRKISLHDMCQLDLFSQ